MADLLTQPWIDSYRSAVEPRLTEIQRAAAEGIWSWLEEIWSAGEGQADRLALEALQEQAAPFFAKLREADTEQLRNAALTDLLGFIRSADLTKLYPRYQPKP